MSTPLTLETPCWPRPCFGAKEGALGTVSDLRKPRPAPAQPATTATAPHFPSEAAPAVTRVVKAMAGKWMEPQPRAARVQGTLADSAKLRMLPPWERLDIRDRIAIWLDEGRYLTETKNHLSAIIDQVATARPSEPDRGRAWQPDIGPAEERSDRGTCRTLGRQGILHEPSP